MNENTTRLIFLAITAVLILFGGYYIVAALPVVAVRCLALLGLFLLPVSFYFGWWLGSRDVRSFLAGLSRGTDTVFHTSDRVADLRTAKIAQARQAQTTPQVRLPEPTRFEIIDVEPANRADTQEL